MLVMDVVKPPAKTQLEDFQRWMNYMQTEFIFSTYGRKNIPITYVDSN